MKVWLPVAATGTRPLKDTRPVLVMVARGAVPMLSRYRESCWPGVKPSPETLYAAPAGPLGADAVSVGAGGQTVNSACAAAGGSPETAYARIAPDRATPAGIVTVVFSVPSAPTTTLPICNPFGLPLSSIRRTR